MDVDIKDTGRFMRPPTIAQDLKDDSRTAVRCDQFVHRGSYSAGSSSSQLPRVGQQSPGSKDFEIVLVTDDQSRRQVRRHAMRQHIRQRRLDGIARLETRRTLIGGWAVREASDPPLLHTPTREGDVQDVSLVNSDVISNDEEQPAFVNGPKSLAVVPWPSGNKREDDSILPAISSCLPYPHPSTGPSGIVDPFDVYPIAIAHADHQLIDHFVVTYPSMMYKIAASVTSNPMAEIFRQFALHDRLSLQALLAIASKHRAGVEGKTESVQSLTHKMRALRMMSEYFREDPRDQRDGTIYAVAAMAVIEKWSKDISIEQIHFNGLLRMIRGRGGMRGMRASNPFLEKVLYWVDFCCAANAIGGTGLPWTGSVPDITPETFDFLDSDFHLPPHSSAIQTRVGTCDYFLPCETFLAFFRRLHELEGVALSSQAFSCGTTSSRTKRFAPGTLLYSIFTILPDYDHGIQDVHFIDEYTCMACLLFLNTALYDCYLKSSNFDRYLDWLDTVTNQLIGHTNHTNPGITAVLWLIFNRGGYPSGEATDNGERCWLVSRLLRVAKRLEWKRNGTVWDRLRTTLIEFVLTQQECALGSEYVDEAALMARQQRRQRRKALWDEDEMGKDILEATSADWICSRGDGRCLV